MPAPLLPVSAEIETPAGWLLLEDDANGYTLHKESFATKTVTSRKTEVDNEWVEGSYTVRAVRANVVEQVVVYIEADDPLELEERLEALTDGLEQLQFSFRKQVGTMRETWTCSYSEYTIETSQELQHATMAIVRATVPRQPTVTRETVP